MDDVYVQVDRLIDTRSGDRIDSHSMSASASRVRIAEGLKDGNANKLNGHYEDTVAGDHKDINIEMFISWFRSISTSICLFTRVAVLSSQCVHLHGGVYRLIK